MTHQASIFAVVCLALASNPCRHAYGQAVIDSALLQLVEQVDVPARAAGVLSAVTVDEGTTVEVGTPIAQIDDREARLLLRRAEIELKLSQEKARDDVAIRSAQRSLQFAQSELNRMDRAATGLPGSISQSQLEETKLKVGKAEFELESAQHENSENKITEELKQQELALGKHEIDVRRILAPVPGVVVEVLRHAGEWVEPGDKVIRIVRVDRLRADGLIHVDQVAAIRRGSAATISIVIPGQSEREVAGEIVFVSPEVNPVNGLVRLSVEFDNANGAFKPGLRARITIPSAAPARPEQRAARAAGTSLVD